jgi:sugar lactone lactonase YvrE
VLLDEVAVDSGTFACALGGQDGRTLFVCSAPTHEPAETVTLRGGRILATTVDVPAAVLD